MATKEELSQLIESVLNLKQGTYLILGTDDEANLVQETPTLAKVREAISTPERKCKYVDTVNLKLPGAGSFGKRIVMLVDDTGMLDDLPTNGLAFHVVSSINGFSHDIHGTAVVVNDYDF